MISRRDLLKLIPASGGLLLLPSLPGCGGLPVDGAVTTSDIGITVLGYGAFPALSKIGGHVIVDVDHGTATVAVVRTGTSTASAVTAICTWGRCELAYDALANVFRCSCHGCIFSVSGDVRQGPAFTSLLSYTANVISSGISVAVRNNQ